MPASHSRRAVLGAVAALAGCTGGDRSQVRQDHPAARDLNAQPRFGPAVAETDATIVAFEDPSCPRCAAFERETVPRIRRELTDSGEATFLFRGIPVVFPWGELATRALEATFARSVSAHWALAEQYFTEQEAFSTDNVRERTRTFLDEQTDIDGAAVIAAVNAGDADAGVETDLDAARGADIQGTPTVVLFRDGDYRTRASGSVSYDLIANALGLD